MQESTNEQPFLGPAIKYQEDGKQEEIRYPYKELKEKLKTEEVVQKPHYDVIVVLGEGPPKDIIFSDEATPEQLAEWNAFIQNPLKAEKEPNFRIIDVSPHGANAAGLDRNPYYSEMKQINDLVSTIQADENEKETLRREFRRRKREQWQKMAHYSKKRWGEMNANAAGYLLYIGVTEKLILTGGKTGGPDKPSEAELMRNKIITRFGRLMFHNRYGDDKELRSLYETDLEVQKENISFETYKENLYRKFIAQEIYPRIILEEKATNTNTNIINTAGRLKEGEKVALITSSHHLERAATFLTRITGIEADRISAQRVLEMVGRTRNKGKLVEIAQEYQIPPGLSINDIVNTDNLNPDLRKKIGDERRMIEYLNDDSRLPFWLSQVLSNTNIVNNESLLKRIFKYLGESSSREQIAVEYFCIAGLDYRYYKTAIETGNLSEEDIDKMKKAMEPLNDYTKYRQYPIEELKKIYPKNFKERYQ